MAKIIFSDAYENDLSRIVEYLSIPPHNVEAVNIFLREHDEFLQFISEHPFTPAQHPKTQKQSWPLGDGRYRVFFKAIQDKPEGVSIYLTHIIDNKQANLEVYPNNTITTYEEE